MRCCCCCCSCSCSCSCTTVKLSSLVMWHFSGMETGRDISIPRKKNTWKFQVIVELPSMSNQKWRLLRSERKPAMLSLAENSIRYVNHFNYISHCQGKTSKTFQNIWKSIILIYKRIQFKITKSLLYDFKNDLYDVFNVLEKIFRTFWRSVQSTYLL